MGPKFFFGSPFVGHFWSKWDANSFLGHFWSKWGLLAGLSEDGPLIRFWSFLVKIRAVLKRGKKVL